MTIISYLSTVRFASGAIRQVPEALVAAGIERPLLVTDAGIVKVGLLERLRNALRPAQAPCFDAVPANPTEDAVLSALEMFKDANCDGLIAIGGGSSLDLAKGVALAAAHPGPLAPYAAICGGAEKISAAVAPVVAIPTTAGTGSEVGRAALLTLRDGRKLGFISPHLIPKQAICDPDLTLGLPATLTAATGMDALTHCIETYLSPRINPPADAIALDGAERAWTWLPLAVDDGTKPRPRWEMMMASLEGGLTFQKGLGAVHGLSHALGASKDPVLHHGTLNAVLLPPVLRFNAGAVPEKYDRLRRAMGLPVATDLADALEEFVASLGLPTRLGDLGVRDDMLAGAAAAAVLDHSTATNPRTVDQRQYEALLRAAMT